MAETGFYLMARGWQDHPVFRGEAFSRRDAFVWLVEEAAYVDRQVAMPKGIITIRRGQIAHSLRYMAKAWKWDEPRVRRFVASLAKAQIIDAATDAGQTVLTLCNYDKYQAPQRATDAPTDAATTQLRRVDDAKNKEGKEGKEYSLPNPSQEPLEVVSAEPVRGGSGRDEQDPLVQVCDAAGFRLRPGPSDARTRAERTVAEWLAKGIDLDTVILPTIRGIVAASTDGPTRVLSRFTPDIQHAHAVARARVGMGATPGSAADPLLTVEGEDPRFVVVRQALLDATDPVMFARSFNPVRFALVDDDHGPIRITDPRPSPLQVMNSPLAQVVRQVVRKHGFADVWS